MSSTLGKMHKVCGYHIILSPRKKIFPGDAQLSVVSVYIISRGGNLTQNGDPRVWKLTFENLKMSNFPWVARLASPSLGKPLIGALSLILSCITLTVFLDHHTSWRKILAIMHHVNEVQM